ncbi:hypothetical protein F4802DRAFT_505264 [Xylaria palmicola]|nr:hypothetical protein F4802DRAFT_505264 [Xylaria palmicola]
MISIPNRQYVEQRAKSQTPGYSSISHRRVVLGNSFHPLSLRYLEIAFPFEPRDTGAFPTNTAPACTTTTGTYNSMATLTISLWRSELFSSPLLFPSCRFFFFWLFPRRSTLTHCCRARAFASRGCEWRFDGIGVRRAVFVHVRSTSLGPWRSASCSPHDPPSPTCVAQHSVQPDDILQPLVVLAVLSLCPPMLRSTAKTAGPFRSRRSATDSSHSHSHCPVFFGGHGIKDEPLKPSDYVAFTLLLLGHLSNDARLQICQLARGRFSFSPIALFVSMMQVALLSRSEVSVSNIEMIWYVVYLWPCSQPRPHTTLFDSSHFDVDCSLRRRHKELLMSTDPVMNAWCATIISYYPWYICYLTVSV